MGLLSYSIGIKGHLDLTKLAFDFGAVVEQVNMVPWGDVYIDNKTLAGFVTKISEQNSSNFWNYGLGYRKKIGLSATFFNLGKIVPIIEVTVGKEEMPEEWKEVFGDFVSYGVGGELIFWRLAFQFGITKYTSSELNVVDKGFGIRIFGKNQRNFRKFLTSSSTAKKSFAFMQFSYIVRSFDRPIGYNKNQSPFEFCKESIKQGTFPPDIPEEVKEITRDQMFVVSLGGIF